MILALLACALIQAPKSEAQATKEPRLRGELKVRVMEAKAARSALAKYASFFRTRIDGQLTLAMDDEQIRIFKEYQERVRSTDEKNTAWLKGVVREHGWPGKSLVGEAAAQDAYYLAQSVQGDGDFLDECLKKMRALPAGEVMPRQIAVIVDLARTERGEKQLYGTRIEVHGDRAVSNDIEDEASVDQRRKEVGLPPLAEDLEEAQKAIDKQLPVLGPR